MNNLYPFFELASFKSVFYAKEIAFPINHVIVIYPV